MYRKCKVPTSEERIHLHNMHDVTSIHIFCICFISFKTYDNETGSILNSTYTTRYLYDMWRGRQFYVFYKWNNTSLKRRVSLLF